VKTTDIPERELSDAFKKALDGRRVVAAIFTTYTFDPGFFELEILPLLFEIGLSAQESIRRAQLEEALRGVEDVVVFYDRSGLDESSGPVRLEFGRVGVSRRGGVWHAKHALVLVEDSAGVRALVLLTTSANLTRSGWWENVEVADLEELRQGDASSLRVDLVDLLDLLGGVDGTRTKHRALELVAAFLREHVSAGEEGPRLWLGAEALTDFLGTHLPGGHVALEVVSPFVDNETAAPLRALVERLAPTSVCLRLPVDAERQPVYTDVWLEHVRAIPGLSFGELPDALLAPGKGDARFHRFVHAKTYRLFASGGKRAWQLVGSPNLTNAAHSSSATGNFETALLREVHGVEASPWLSPVTQPPPTGLRVAPEPGERPWAGLRLSLRYDWRTNRLSYHHEEVENAVPPILIGRAVDRSMDLGSVALLARIEPVQTGTWVDLPASAAERLRTELLTGGLVAAWPENAAVAQPLLVQEVGCEARPSILSGLTPAEILEYWSLLTPAQRELAHERLLLRGLGGADVARDRPAPPSMFDTFAGIFHGFARLSDHVREALDADREKEAIYRIYGTKYDSLGSLVQRVLAPPKGETIDAVSALLILLSADDVLGDLERTQAAFVARNREAHDALRDRLRAIDGLRSRLELGPDGDAFFGWFLGAWRVPVVLSSGRPA
jgi:hypothetical protein